MAKVVYEGSVYVRPSERGVVMEEPEKIEVDGTAEMTGEVYLDELAAVAAFGLWEQGKPMYGDARLRIAIERVDEATAERVAAIKKTDAANPAYKRHGELISKKFTGGLTGDEAAELAECNRLLDEAEADFYAPAKRMLAQAGQTMWAVGEEHA